MPGNLPPRVRRREVADFFSENARSWRDRYDAETFDAYNYQARAAVALGWLDQLQRAGSGRLLELGCGAGVQASAASRSGWDVTAADLSLPLLRQAADSLRGPHWLAAGAEDLPFKTGEFDAVMMLGVIGYVPDPLRALRAVGEVLRPGGWLVISWAQDPPLFWDGVSQVVSWLPDRLYMSGKSLLGGKRLGFRKEPPSFYQSHNRFWPEGSFTKLLESAGYRVHSLRAVNYGRFRFVGKRLWPESVDIGLSRVLDRASNTRVFSVLRRTARTHLALARVDSP